MLTFIGFTQGAFYELLIFEQIPIIYITMFVMLLDLEPSAIITWTLFKHNVMRCLKNIWSSFSLENYLNPLNLFYNKFLYLNLIETFKNKNLTPGLHFCFGIIDIFCWMKKERKWRSNLELLGPIVLIV